MQLKIEKGVLELCIIKFIYKTIKLCTHNRITNEYIAIITDL